MPKVPQLLLSSGHYAGKVSLNKKWLLNMHLKIKEADLSLKETKIEGSKLNFVKNIGGKHAVCKDLYENCLNDDAIVTHCKYIGTQVHLFTRKVPPSIKGSKLTEETITGISGNQFFCEDSYFVTNDQCHIKQHAKGTLVDAYVMDNSEPIYSMIDPNSDACTYNLANNSDDINGTMTTINFFNERLYS